MVSRRQTVGPPFCVSGGVYFRRSTVGDANRSSHHSRSDAHGCRRGRGNGHAVWNSDATGRKPHPGEQRTCRHKRSVQRRAFVADRADDWSTFRRTKTIVDLEPYRAHRRRDRHCAVGEFFARSFSRLDRSCKRYFGGQSVAQHRWIHHRRACFYWHPWSRVFAWQEEAL